MLLHIEGVLFGRIWIHVVCIHIEYISCSPEVCHKGASLHTALYDNLLPAAFGNEMSFSVLCYAFHVLHDMFTTSRISEHRKPRPKT